MPASSTPGAATRSTAELPPPRAIEVRLGLVLYGGVSLAIYEAGVTQAFFDLVTARDEWRQGSKALLKLLDILDADAAVDTIAGTSAGGINGLMLAAALESGTDFSSALPLWLLEGDLNALLRTGDDPATRSLLDGEGHYQRQLFRAFRELVKDQPHATKYARELDVFVTGTDLHGAAHQHEDALGSRIDETTHRVVLHLKHRPKRCRLGVRSAPENASATPGEVPPAADSAEQVQAAVLAAASRITSAFPVAFPPFHESQLDELDLGKSVTDRAKGALAALITRPYGAERASAASHFIDGGILDNKPFGALLRAIFYRMPTGRVDRRVFYVEPHPATNAPRKGGTDVPSPVRVAFSALTLPSSESILDDVNAVREHNARLDWLKEMARDLPADAPAPGAGVSKAYLSARRACLAKTLAFTASNSSPGAHDHPSPDRQPHYDAMERALAARLEGASAENLNPWDVEFHLRRAFHVLYRLHDQRPIDAERLRAAGRLIAAFEVVRAALLDVRDRARRHARAEDAERTLGCLQRFLCDVDRVWASLALRSERATAGGVASFLNEHLSDQLLGMIRDEARTSATRISTPGGLASVATGVAITQRTVLSDLGGHLEALAPEWCKGFPTIDAHLYPAEYLTGIHELDTIDLVRISPTDARLGLSGNFGDPMEKIAGEGLAHFAAFLREDWRANDLVWGHLDGTCQLVRALLDRQARARLEEDPQATAARLNAAFPDLEAVTGAFPACPVPFCHALLLATRKLSEQLAALAPAARRSPACAGWDEFQGSLIMALHRESVARGIELVTQARSKQDARWGSTPGRAVVESDPGERFLSLRLGAESIFGSGGRVPLPVLAMYGLQSYVLLWRMLENSGLAVMTLRRMRTVFVTPAHLMLRILRLGGRPVLADAMGVLSLVSLLGATFANAALTPPPVVQATLACSVVALLVVFEGVGARSMNFVTLSLHRVALAAALAGAGALVGQLEFVRRWLVGG